VTALLLLVDAFITLVRAKGARALVFAVPASLIAIALVDGAMGAWLSPAFDRVTRAALALLVVAVGCTMLAWRHRRAAWPRDHFFCDVWCRRAFARAPRRLLVAGAALLVLVELSLHAGLVASVLGTTSDAQSLDLRFALPSLAHPFGTDQVGRDLLLRLLFGGRVSLFVAFTAACATAFVGGALGLLAAERGGFVDELLMRATDAMLALPLLPLMLVVAAVDPERVRAQLDEGPPVLLLSVASAFVAALLARALARRGAARLADAVLLTAVAFAGMGLLVVGAHLLFTDGPYASVGKVAFVLLLFGWMKTARVTRVAAASVRHAGFVVAARALGARSLYIAIVHVLPHAAPALLVAATLEVGAAILTEAALSFLGLGVAPPLPSWGNMLYGALDAARASPWLILPPGIAICVAVACFQVLGDGIRDALAPEGASEAPRRSTRRRSPP
jgi:peptide/nickel transport system permease protein